MMLPTAPPTALAAVLIVPRAWNAPESGVSTTSASGCPETLNGPRAMVQWMSASGISGETAPGRLPARLRGACVLSASPIADMAMAAGASTVDTPASGLSGCTAVSAGRPSLSVAGERGHRTFIARVAPMKETATTRTPRMMLRGFIHVLKHCHLATIRAAHVGR
jgi:hypothetical protein